MIRRGEIYYADLDPTIGSEQGGIRPILVIQNNIGNKHSPTIIVVPISSANKSRLPIHIAISGNILHKNSVVLTEQIRTLDRSRLREYIGMLDKRSMKRVDEALKISIGV